MGASVLIFANKTDVGDCMSNEEIKEVFFFFLENSFLPGLREGVGTRCLRK